MRDDDPFRAWRLRRELPLRGLEELARLRAALLPLEDAFVGAARRSGSTWAEIGAALGVTRQAMRRRHPGARRERL